ncbi:MAG: cupin domain-containing protein [Planctomycetota bacterium]|nr:MAG: cupin domain-containing protein [Planctomycetota bacterium]
MSSNAKPTIAVQLLDDLQPVEAYDFADSRFLFVQPEMGLFYTRVMARSTMPAHVHQTAHQFSFIVGGKGSVEIGDRRIEVEKGMCIRIPAGLSHSWHNPGDEMLEYVEAKIPARRDSNMIDFVKDRFPNIDDRQLAIDL